jgi:outer membrane immunogenic protein
MKYLLAGLIALTAAGSASAADLAYRGPRPPVAAPIYSPFYNWTGFYVGINGGGGWGNSTWDGIGGFSVSGGMIGVTAGYNYQINQFVLGAEADIDWSGMNGSNNGCFLGCETRNSWLATVRGRLGYSFDRFMPYLTAGVALGNISASLPLLPILPGGSSTTAGWTAGAGFEVALFRNVTAKAEYLFVDLGDFNCGLNCGLLPNGNVSFYANVLRGGINFRF